MPCLGWHCNLLGTDRAPVPSERAKAGGNPGAERLRTPEAAFPPREPPQDRPPRVAVGTRPALPLRRVRRLPAGAGAEAGPHPAARRIRTVLREGARRHGGFGGFAPPVPAAASSEPGGDGLRGLRHRAGTGERRPLLRDSLSFLIPSPPPVPGPCLCEGGGGCEAGNGGRGA